MSLPIEPRLVQLTVDAQIYATTLEAAAAQWAEYFAAMAGGFSGVVTPDGDVKLVFVQPG